MANTIRAFTSRSPRWSYPATENETVRRENEADSTAVETWQSYQFSWRTYRWRPIWNYISTTIAGFGLMGGLWVILLNLAPNQLPVFRDAQFSAVPECVVLAAATYALILVIPAAHESESAHWTMRADADVLAVSKSGKSGTPISIQLARREAGELAVDLRWEQTRNSAWWEFRWAAGRSIDGQTELVLGKTHLGQPHTVLVSWWPVNDRSREALKSYEEAGFGYWSPSGQAPEARVSRLGLSSTTKPGSEPLW